MINEMHLYDLSAAGRKKDENSDGKKPLRLSSRKM